MINLPFFATVAFEEWWEKAQEVLKACPGNVGAGAAIGLWNALAYPSYFLNLMGFEDYATTAAAIRGTIGAWLQENPPPGVTTWQRRFWAATWLPPATRR